MRNAPHQGAVFTIRGALLLAQQLRLPFIKLTHWLVAGVDISDDWIAIGIAPTSHEAFLMLVQFQEDMER